MTFLYCILNITFQMMNQFVDVMTTLPFSANSSSSYNNNGSTTQCGCLHSPPDFHLLPPPPLLPMNDLKEMDLMNIFISDLSIQSSCPIDVFSGYAGVKENLTPIVGG